MTLRVPDRPIAAHPGVVEACDHQPRHGWTYVRFETADVAVLERLLRLAWSAVAPKKLVQGAA